MDPKFIPSQKENSLYAFWEKNGYFKAKVDKSKRPFCIILPPPNANADLHLGHAMYVYEDVMIRYHKMKGEEVLWLPGADHAGFETQFVFEKHLQKQGKSRFDYDRETLFRMIWDFVMENKSAMENQLRKLGFALDWSKKKFTLDPDIVAIVHKTFADLHQAGLIYRAKRLVNYCTYCGTSFSDLEVVYKERIDPLFYLKYGPFTLATTRPETKFGDTAVAVHPRDKRYTSWIGKEIQAEGLLGSFKIKVIADAAVDPKFGTGVVKVTPAHDFSDFEMGQRHNLEMKQVIDFTGKLNERTGPYKGLRINEARKKVVEDLQKKGLVEKIKEDYSHRVGTCYKCGRIIEPLPKEQWFVNVKPLTSEAKKLVEKNEIIVYPKRFRKILLWWLGNFRDWNISRQVVWGIRIPAYFCKSTKKWFISVEKPNECASCKKQDFEQDSDTFDTWFSSAQWPYATLKTIGEEMYRFFYPTSVMETGYDILPWWVARMIMIGYFATKQVPFKTVFLHGLVRDRQGQKMSKSKGNVINPMQMIERYGADALRASLVFGVRDGGDIIFTEEKVIGMRNFANKVWNIGRFIFLNKITNYKSQITNQIPNSNNQILEELEKEFKEVKKKYLKYMDTHRYTKAFDLLYHFIWHRFADYYVEQLKDGMKNGNIEASQVLTQVFEGQIQMIHPFMPFVTEAIWKVLKGEGSSILNTAL